MKNWWFTTDTHFNHSKIGLGRPPNWEERLWRGLSRIPPHALLIHLGDFCLTQDADAHFRLRTLPVQRKILVRGNHDRKSTSWYLDHGWSFVCDSFQLEAFGLQLVFTHRPKADIDEEFGTYQAIYEEWINIHGHSHNQDTKLPTSHYLKLAVEETNYLPIKLDTFLKQKGKI